MLEHEASLADLRLQFETGLLQFDTTKLDMLTNYLKLDIGEVTHKFEIIQLIRDVVNKELKNAPSELASCDYIQDLIALLTNAPPPLERVPAEPTVNDIPEVELSRKIAELKVKHAHELQELEASLQNSPVKDRHTIANSVPYPVFSPPVQTSESHAILQPTYFRREFKIAGQVGEPNQPDKLTYVALIHQIDNGIKRGYHESEVVDAIIKAISPHSSLRNYVLTLQDRSLVKLRKILRVFFQEQNASELYQQLLTTFQHPKETAQQFLLRILDTRNKVMFASREEGTEVQYSEQLVQGAFLKAFEIGLRDESLLINMRPSLRMRGVTDEDLMRLVNEMATVQAERKMKIGSSAARIHMLSTQPEARTPAMEQSLQETQLQHAFAAIKEIKSQLSELKQNQVKVTPQVEMPSQNTRSQTLTGNKQSYPLSRKCFRCRDNGTTGRCLHCFSCGAYGHIKADCRKKDSGNGARLLPRDDK